VPAPRDPAQPATEAGRTRVAVAATTAPVETPAEPTEAEPVAEQAVTAVAVVETDGNLSLEAFSQMWPAVLDTLEGESPMLAAALREARPSGLADQDLTLAWPESAAFSKRQAEDPAKRELIAQSIRAVTGASLRLAYELGAEAHEAETLSEDELVARFKHEFGAVEEPPKEEES